jgi:integrase
MAKTPQARGFGNIRKLQSGKWQVRYTDPQGLARTGRITFSSKREAEFELSKIREAIERGTWQVDQSPQAGDLDPRTVTLEQLAKHWRQQAVTAQGRPLAPRTLLEYERLITRTLEGFKDKPIRAITTQQLEKWRAGEMNRGKLNQTSKAYKHLQTLMTWAHKRKWIVANPCTIERATSYRPAQPPTPTKQQVELMLANSSEEFALFLALASQGGLRKGEILELRLKDISKATETEPGARITVARAVTWVNGLPVVKTPKTTASARTVLLPSQASELLRAHLKRLNTIDPEALLFHRGADTKEHWGEHHHRYQWQKVSDLAGFKGRFHSLRSYHLTQYALTGATTREIMDRGGHTNIQTAMGYQQNTGREAELVARLAERVAQ